MAYFDPLYTIIGFIVCILAIIHAVYDARENRIQRLLMLLFLFTYAVFFEYIGVITGIFTYAPEIIMIFNAVPLAIPLTWVGIIYSTIIICERMKLSSWQYILVPTLIALSLDWGMDPISVELGAWTFGIDGSYFRVPGFNYIGWFFIPLAFLFSYSLNWNKEKKRLQLLTLSEIDKNHSLSRKLYTFLVIPISIGILFLVGMLSLIPVLNNMPFIPMVAWLILTVVSSSGVIIWKRKDLKRVQWYDLIPPGILFFLEWNYALLGFLISRYDLGLLMLLTGTPLLLSFIFTLRKAKE